MSSSTTYLHPKKRLLRSSCFSTTLAVAPSCPIIPTSNSTAMRTSCTTAILSCPATTTMSHPSSPLIEHQFQSSESIQSIQSQFTLNQLSLLIERARYWSYIRNQTLLSPREFRWVLIIELRRLVVDLDRILDFNSM